MEENRPMNFFRFEDLRIYHKTLDFVSWVYNATKPFPDYASILRNDMVEAAQEITINIAEGSGRNKNQFIYYLKMARSSIRKSVVLITIAQKEGFITDDQHEEAKNLLIEISKMLGALISSLQRNKKTDRSASEEVEEEEEEEDFDENTGNELI
ncbi:MAG: four helix bundle protein [Bacteroidales bacterium]|jgi:four helix bundle protein|nr:four helix bundle protein [Bacteroidales bacterium]MDI9575792.1 four helix bundle protein [Bacteroidota bacterium]MDD3755577.1 four helix bundle protein [Bacteroidales bacterium]MDY0400756.1 four helix bundle protein [Bacteroidales bacterium]HHW59115.1 four helix bundle protein [Bacteroidales bacterium]